MQVTVGQVYLMYISNWSQSSTGFSLNWNLQNGASLDCTILPIELIDFQAFPVGDKVELQWSTASETNSDRFMIERSKDGAVFEPIGMVTAAGNSAQMNQYAHLDRSPYPGLNYYRLQQVDLDGTFEHSAAGRVRFWGPGAGVTLVANRGSGLVDVLLRSSAVGSTWLLRDAAGRVGARRVVDRDPASRITTSPCRQIVHGVAP